jgi:hypothetical protein
MSQPRSDKDDWQQLAAQHRQEQFTNKVQRISRQGRRGNRIVGAFLMLIGAALLVFLAVRAFLEPVNDAFWRDLRGMIYLGSGGVVTIATGAAIWRGTFTRH